MVFEAIIFDIDGTIVNSPEVQWYAFNDYLKQYNIQISWSVWINQYLGEKSETIWRAVFSECNLVVDIDELLIFQNEVIAPLSLHESCKDCYLGERRFSKPS